MKGKRKPKPKTMSVPKKAVVPNLLKTLNVRTGGSVTGMKNYPYQFRMELR